MKSKQIMFLLAAGLATALFATSPSVTWYVDASASAGGSGLSAASAFPSIAEAVSAASSGDTIQIAAGTYAENVVVEGKALTLVGAGRDATVIDANESGRPLYLKGAAVTGTRVKSLCLANGRADVGAGLYVDDAGVDVGFLDGKITDCVSTGNGAAVNGPAWVVRTLIGRCWSTGDTMAAITGAKGLFSCVIINCGRGSVTISGSTCTGSHSPVLDTYASGEQIKVVNCTFSNNSGILTKHVYSSLGNLVIRNCAFFGVQVRWMIQGFKLQYCFGSRGGVLINGNHNIGGDDPRNHSGERWPSTHFQIVAPFSDWRPLVGSDLLESGNSEFVTDLVPEEYRATDYYGNARIQGEAVDIGAAEGAVSAAGGIVFFPMAFNGPAFSCATNLWINGYRVIAPDNLTTAGNPTWANGIHFASTEKPRTATLEFRYFPDRSLVLWGATNQTGTATYPNSKGMLTFVMSDTAGYVETNTLINAASVRWVSPDGDDGNNGMTSATPFKTLQKAATSSVNYGVVFAKPGTYAEGSDAGVSDTDNAHTTSNRLYISKSLYFVSTDGPEATVIKGRRATGEGTYDGCGPGALRCVQLYTINNVEKACVCGFTLTGGATDSSPIAKAITRNGTFQPGNDNRRGNFAGSAASGHLWGNINIDKLQLVDCIVSNNVSYFGTVYSVVAKNCVFTDNRIVNEDSSGDTVTAAGGAMGKASKFFGCLAYANDPVRNWIIGHASGLCMYDSTIVGDVGISSSSVTVRNSVFMGGTLPTGAGVVSGASYMFADSDNGDYRPVPGSKLFSSASSDILQDNYVKFGTLSIDGIGYAAESGQPLVVGAYRGASAYPDTRTDWYVDASKANDSGDGRTPATAKKTLAAVMALVRRGDTVHAAPGTYDEGEMTNTVKIVNASTDCMGSRVVVPDSVSLVADEGPDVTFIKGRLGSGSSGYGEGALRGVYLNENTLLEGFTVADCRTVESSYVKERSCGACVVAPQANVARPAVIRNCRLTNGKARSGSAAYGGVLERCRIDDCTVSSDGITWYAKLDNCVLISTVPSSYNNCALRSYYAVRNSTIYVENERGDPDFTQGTTGAPIENSIIFYKNIQRASTLKNAKNCIICTPANTNLAIDASCSGLIQKATLGEVVDTTTYRPVAGSAAIDAGDMTLFAAHPSELDCGGGQRIYSGVVDIGAYEYAPFEAMGAALAAKDVSVDVADESATVGTGVLLPNGALEAVWQKKSSTARCEVTFQVTGGGVLVVTDETGEIGRYAANGEEKFIWAPPGIGGKRIRFSYQPAANEAPGAGAAILHMEVVSGFVILFK